MGVGRERKLEQSGQLDGRRPQLDRRGGHDQCPDQHPLTVTLDIPLTLGTLTLGNSNSSSVGYTLSGSGANTLTLNNSGRGATISVTNGSHAINAAVVLADNLVVSGSGTLAFGNAGITNNGGGYSLTMNGTGGTLILGGSNTYSGGTILNAGILQAGNNSALGASTAALAVNGGTLDVHGYNLNIGPLSGTGTIDDLSGSGTLTAGNGNSSSTFAGTMQNTAGQLSLVKTGLGTLTLSASSGYTGTTLVSGGTLLLATSGAIGGSTFDSSGGGRSVSAR